MDPEAPVSFVNLLETSSFLEAGDFIPEQGEVTDVAVVCFVGERLAIVRPDTGTPWDLVLGAAHAHESAQEATERVVSERTRMKVIAWKLLGYLVIPTEEGNATVAISSANIVPDDVHQTDTDGLGATMKVVELPDVRNYLPWTSTLSDLLHRAVAGKHATETGL